MGVSWLWNEKEKSLWILSMASMNLSLSLARFFWFDSWGSSNVCVGGRGAKPPGVWHSPQATLEGKPDWNLIQKYQLEWSLTEDGRLRWKRVFCWWIVNAIIQGNSSSDNSSSSRVDPLVWKDLICGNCNSWSYKRIDWPCEMFIWIRKARESNG